MTASLPTPAVAPAAPPAGTADTLTPRELAEIVRGAAARPELWQPRLLWTEPDRYYVRLPSPASHELWLLTWLPGQGTEIHGHGGAAGAFAVVAGELTERSFSPSLRPTGAEPRLLTSGAVRSFGARHIHDVVNRGELPAASIHAYSPALSTMTYYRELPDGTLVTDRVEGVE
jgi:predicted metal-dependent enzyme (double-stranded beta helix superfamily)